MEWRLKGDGKRAEFRESIILSALNRSLSILEQSYGSMHPSRIFLTFFLASFLVILLLPFCPRQVFSFIDLSDSPVSRFLARSSPPAYFAFPPSPSSVLVVLVRFRCRFDRLVHPSLSLSSSLPPDRANLLSFFHSVLSFPRSSLHVRRSPRHERSKEGIAEWQCRWAYRRALISAFRARRLSIPRDKGPTATAAAHPDL